MSMEEAFDKLDGATRGCQEALDDLQFVIDKRLDDLRAVVVERNTLRRERDALRSFVGDLEYYFARWEGVSPDVREWLQARLRKLSADVIT